jgi:hypothetical protein
VAPGDIPARYRGKLRVTSLPTKRLEISGGLKILELRYTKDLTLDALLPSIRRKPTQTRTLDRAEETVEFAIDLSAENNLVIDNNLAKAEFKTDIKLVGTNLRPGLLGSATPLHAKLFFNNVEYDVTSGSIDFIEHYQVLPRFDARMKATACGAELNVSVSGTVDQYTIDAHGRDQNGILGRDEALNCLALGYRPSSTSLAVTPGDTGNIFHGLDALATVTGIDQKIKKLLPIDQVRFGTGYSLRARRTTPRIILQKELLPGVQLRLHSSLLNSEDQKLEIELPLSSFATMNLGWSNATEIANDVGFDLKSRWDF